MTTQSRDADAVRAALLETTRTLEVQFRKQLDSLLTQTTTAGRQVAEAPDAPDGLAPVLTAALTELHRLTLPGTELDEAFQVVVQPLHRTLSSHYGARREVQDMLVRTQKLLNLYAALVQQATESAGRMALLSTGLQLGATTLRTSQERLTAVSEADRTGRRAWLQRAAAAARAKSPSFSAQAETRKRVRP